MQEHIVLCGMTKPLFLHVRKQRCCMDAVCCFAELHSPQHNDPSSEGLYGSGKVSSLAAAEQTQPKPTLPAYYNQGKESLEN